MLFVVKHGRHRLRLVGEEDAAGRTYLTRRKKPSGRAWAMSTGRPGVGAVLVARGVSFT